MKAVVAYCLLSVFLASPAFAVYSGSSRVDTVRDAKSGELYRIRQAILFTCNEGATNTPERGFGFEVSIKYQLENVDSSKNFPICPDGWETDGSECVLIVSISYPLTFYLDTGENRNRRISKVERDSAFKQCVKDFKFAAVAWMSGGGISGKEPRKASPVPDFVYIDKSGKSREVTFVREYVKARGQFATSFFYQIDSGKCDEGFLLLDRSKQRKYIQHKDFFQDECHWILRNSPF